MNKMQRKVHEFLLKHMGAVPSGWPNKTGTLNKWLLIQEEYCELTEALGLDAFIDNDGTGPYLDYKYARPFDEPKTVDAICDLLYVIFNLCEELELDIEPFFNEVHRSNMTKVPAALSPNKKVQKGPSWEAPRIAEMLERVNEGKRHRAENNLKDPTAVVPQSQCPLCDGKGTITATYINAKGDRLDVTTPCPDLCDDGTVRI